MSTEIKNVHDKKMKFEEKVLFFIIGIGLLLVVFNMNQMENNKEQNFMLNGGSLMDPFENVYELQPENNITNF